MQVWQSQLALEKSGAIKHVAMVATKTADAALRTAEEN